MIDCLYLLFLLLIRPQTEKGPHRKEGSERKIPSFSPPHSFSHKFSAPPPSIKKNEEEEGEKRRWRWRRRRKRERFCRGSLARMLEEEEEEEVHCGGVGFTIHGIKSKVARKTHTKKKTKNIFKFFDAPNNGKNQPPLPPPSPSPPIGGSGRRRWVGRGKKSTLSSSNQGRKRE